MAMGTVMLLLGIRVRLGGLRSRVLMYRDFRLPWFIRNATFGLIPGGLGFVCIGAIGLAAPHLNHPLGDLVVLVAVSVGTVSVAIGLVWAYRVPDVAKPAWLLEEEAQQGQPTDPSVIGRRLDQASVIIIVIPAVLAAAVILVSGLLWLASLPFE